jgi:hypothetical protein
MRLLVATALASVLATVVLVTVAVEQGPKAPESTLSQRINAACKKGYELGDWTTTNPVRVTCIEITPGADHNYDSYVTAVTR